jgi:hypothetical protein
MVRRFLLVLVLLLLVTFGWWLIRKDRALERRELQREKAADIIAEALERAVRATEDELRNRDAVRAAAITPDSIALILEGAKLEALPYGRLLFHPLASPGFKSADADEVMRSADDLRRRGAYDGALAAYAQGIRMAWTATGDVPTELFARAARCDLLAALGRTRALRVEALELRDLLLDGRWRITRATFAAYLQAASNWSRAGERPASERLALSEAVERLYGAEAVPPVALPATASRSTISAGGVHFTVLLQNMGARSAALIAGPLYLEHVWKAQIKAIEERSHVRVVLAEPVAAAATNPNTAVREAKDTGLPWTITVSDER